mgnify:CR=1 FL=1
MRPTPPPSPSLTQAEHWFRILAETMPVAIFVHRDKLLYVNPAAEALTGYSAPELMDMGLEDLVEPLSLSDNGSAAPSQPSGEAEVWKLQRKDGRERWIRLTSGYVELDWQPATLVTAFDVTAQEQSAIALHDVRQRLAFAQQAARSVTWEWDPESDDLDTSELIDQVFGLSLHDQIETGGDFLDMVHPEDRPNLERALLRLLKAEDDNLAIEIRCLSPRGEIRWLAERAVAMRDEDGQVHRVIGVAHDITERKIAENALFQEKERAFVTLASIADGVIRTDARGIIDYLNPVAQKLTGWTLEEAYGQAAGDVYRVVDEETGKKVLDPVHHCLEERREVAFLGQRLLVRRDGGTFPIHDSAAPIRGQDGKVTGSILVFKDLTQVRRAEDEMEHLASHDPLTGLINRREFERQLRQTLQARDGRTGRHALCQLDLDAFKLVNETCGHTAGDQLIRKIASVIEERVRQQDVLARLGGDEFGILFRDCSPEEAEQRAKEIGDAIHSFRFHWGGRTFTNRVSGGLAPLSSSHAGADALLSAADAACFVAKDKGGGSIHIYQPGDREIAERYGEMQWISRLQKALDEDRFRLYHQIIKPLGTSDSEPPLSELFIRLIDEEGKLVYPGSFIPAAERYGLIPTIDRWVLSTALRLMAHGGNGVMAAESRFAINLSGLSLGADGFLDFVVDELDKTGIPPERVFFEITETSAIANLPMAMRFISVLKGMGCRFVLDDFGQGLSSFGYLKNLPLDFLKIDGGFVREMVADPIQAALVASIHEIGEVMGLRTIAESVEDEATLEALRQIGVDYVQGYLFQRPRPLSEI